MQTLLAPFQPHLEDALAEEIRKLKRQDAFSPLLIVVPSGPLRRYLKKMLAARGFTLLNVHLLTFHQLSLRLFAETHGMNVPELHGGLFFEEALRQLIRCRVPGTEAFAGIERHAGGSAALWQTLRDLYDATVDPALAGEALSEGHFAPHRTQRTDGLLALLQLVRGVFETRGITDHTSLAEAATARVPQSVFLRQMRRIFYYGFYDLTQVQLDFFHAVAARYATTLLFPGLPTRPPYDAWSFAERFYQRYVQGRAADDHSRDLVAESEADAPLPSTFAVFDRESGRCYGAPPQGWRCTIIDAFGVQDEIDAVAKEILRLREEEGVPFDDIGVAARTLDGYGAVVRQAFERHRIPIAGAIEEPLVQFPLAKAAILLLNLAANDYPRSQVIDLLAAPFFNFRASGRAPRELRPDLWDLATRELAICSGIREWERLERFTENDLVLPGSGEEHTRSIPADQLRTLLRIVKKLAADLGRLPARASWRRHAEMWQKLFRTWLGIGNERTAPGAGVHGIGEEIARALEEIAALDAFSEQVFIEEFCRTFQHWLERSSLITTDENVHGVAVMNVPAARGIGFGALFILGMNEGLFPRTIREDAFLRDRDREVLERDLGYKISQKLAAFDEEKLLFSLLVNAARDRLYCTYQRCDEEGRVLAPSWYLAELKRAIGPAGERHWTEIRIPRSITDKAGCAPFDREELLLPEEIAVRRGLAGQNARLFMEAAELSPALYEAGLHAIRQIEAGNARLTPFDGIISRMDDYWRRLSERGISPTSLEIYARCPFQYFAYQVMGLEPLEDPEESEGPSFAEYGELGHEILKHVYRALMDCGYFACAGSPIDVERIVRSAAEQAFTAYERSHPVGYPLAWEILREKLTELIRAVLRHDLEELAGSGYVPVALEAALEDRLPADWPSRLAGLPVRGRIDRLDFDSARNRVRIVDYKFKLGATQTSSDRDLEKAALRGVRLQPPIYSLLGRRWAERNQAPGASVEAAFFYIAPLWRDGPLIRQPFGEETLTGEGGAAIKSTIDDLLAGIGSGSFFMHRGEHCQYCRVAEICRKNHPPSVWRAENDPVTESHRQLRDKAPKKT